ncbi:MAG TPA: hypothetical protein VNS22_01340 [Geminicoccus sp.]|uniref:hypothetical protein n=1 Tax=Geminicoccus sp. TaxID=2024832 RepID=UPI002D1BAFE4|nr:hypothetical protein [Geminicoccus sp.]HWL67008.1 hypothetical protein [Geminicoccus sp.]
MERAIGVLWYRREHYDELRRLFPDGRQLPDTFDQWLSEANEGMARIEEMGAVPVKATLDLFDFPRWCAMRGLSCDYRARQLFVAEFVHDHQAQAQPADEPASVPPPVRTAASARRRARRGAQWR